MWGTVLCTHWRPTQLASQDARRPPGSLGPCPDRLPALKGRLDAGRSLTQHARSSAASPQATNTLQLPLAVNGGTKVPLSPTPHAGNPRKCCGAGLCDVSGLLCLLLPPHKVPTCSRGQPDPLDRPFHTVLLCSHPENLPEPGKSSPNPAWSRPPAGSQVLPEPSSCPHSHINSAPGFDSGVPWRDPELQTMWPLTFPPWDLPPLPFPPVRVPVAHLVPQSAAF